MPSWPFGTVTLSPPHSTVTLFTPCDTVHEVPRGPVFPSSPPQPAIITTMPASACPMTHPRPTLFPVRIDYRVLPSARLVPRVPSPATQRAHPRNTSRV